MATPVRAVWPLPPRPPVLPLPEPMPRPTRMRDLRAPGLSRSWSSFMVLNLQQAPNAPVIQFAGSIFSIWATLSTIPRIEGVSSTTFERFILLRPRAFSVSFWPGLRPIGLPVWVILIFAIVTYPLLAGFGGGIAALAENVAHLLGAARGNRTRRVAMLERIERRLDHVVRVRGADRLRDDVMDAE